MNVIICLKSEVLYDYNGRENTGNPLESWTRFGETWNLFSANGIRPLLLIEWIQVRTGVRFLFFASFQVPCVTLIGNITWFPTDFLLKKLPHMAKALDKKAQQAVASGRTTWLQTKTQTLTKWVLHV